MSRNVPPATAPVSTGNRATVIGVAHAMRRKKLREKTERALNHSAMGMALGVLLALGLLFGNASRIYALIIEAFGSVRGPASLIVGCALVIGVGTAVTGFIFDEVERS